MQLFTALDRLARAQHGLVHRSQVLDLGVTDRTLRRWVALGRLVAVHATVYRLAGTPVTWEQQVLAAVLAAGDGAVASHRSAARLWGMLEDEMLEVTVPVERRPRLHGVVVHRSSDVAAGRPVVHHGVPTTTPMRTLVDLGAVVRAPVVEDALDEALEKRLLTVAGAEWALDDLARNGRSGAGVLRHVLDHRALGDKRPDSLLEPRMARLLRNHDLPPFAFQHRVVHAGRFVAKVDFAYPDRRLAIEVDGFAKHSSPEALQADLERQNRLVAAGWTVLRFTWQDVVRRPKAVATQVSDLLWTLPTT